MNKNFIEKKINIKDFLKETKSNSVLISNNERQIDIICDFLQENKKLLLVNGFAGTGKSEIINFVLSNMLPNVLVMNYICFETTILDDMLLSFFELFRNYALEGKIVPPKIKVENFTQKINSYFNSIENPIIIVLSSFQSILKENKQEILNFIEHLSKYPNIKIILSSRSFNYEDW
jgi:Cdc6-like AAA superfamily ATPase